MPNITRQSKNGRRKTKSRKANVVDRIRPLHVEDLGIKMCVYGRSGTGKTTFWGTFPGKILTVLCSGGRHSGELLSLSTAEYKKKISEVQLQSASELKELIQHVQEEGGYETIVIDHVTQLQDLVLQEVLGLDEIPEQLSWGIATQEQYGQVSLQLKTYLREVLSLPCNVVIIAQERTFNSNDETSGSSALQPFIAPALSPSAVGWLLNAVDFVVETFIRKKIEVKTIKIRGKDKKKEVDTGEVEYCLRTAPDDIYSTKFRKPKGKELPKEIVDPTYDKIVNLLK